MEDGNESKPNVDGDDNMASSLGGGMVACHKVVLQEWLLKQLPELARAMQIQVPPYEVHELTHQTF